MDSDEVTGVMKDDTVDVKDKGIEEKEPLFGEKLLPLVKEHPELLCSGYPSIFDKPCPDNKSGDISKNVDVNEWVFNHLPLSTDQKKEFLAYLMAMQTVESRKDKREESKTKSKPRKVIRRKGKKVGPKELAVISSK